MLFPPVLANATYQFPWYACSYLCAVLTQFFQVKAKLRLSGIREDRWDEDRFRSTVATALGVYKWQVVIVAVQCKPFPHLCFSLRSTVRNARRRLLSEALDVDYSLLSTEEDLENRTALVQEVVESGELLRQLSSDDAFNTVSNVTQSSVLASNPSTNPSTSGNSSTIILIAAVACGFILIAVVSVWYTRRSSRAMRSTHPSSSVLTGDCKTELEPCPPAFPDRLV